MHCVVVAGKPQRHRIGMAAHDRGVARTEFARRLGQPRLGIPAGADQRRLLRRESDFEFGRARKRAHAAGDGALERLLRRFLRLRRFAVRGHFLALFILVNERTRRDLFPLVGTREGEIYFGDVSLDLAPSASIFVSLFDGLARSRFQAGELTKLTLDASTMLEDRILPAPRSALGLVIPFEHVQKDNGERALQLIVFAFGHVLNFLGDIQRIDLGKARRP